VKALVRLVDRASALLFFLALLILWEAGCRLFSVPDFLLPSPTRIVSAGFSVPLERWGDHICATLRVALLGYVFAIAVSIPLAVLLSNSRVFNKTLYPLLVVIQSTPVVAVAPILVVTLGAGDLPRILITFMISFFPIVVSTVTGLSSVPEELIELSRSLRASRMREIMRIRLPHAVPYIFSALRVSITLSIIGAVVAELVAANRGLGYSIAFLTSMFKVPQAFATLLVLVIISLALFRLIGGLQHWLAPWSLP